MLFCLFDNGFLHAPSFANTFTTFTTSPVNPHPTQPLRTNAPQRTGMFANIKKLTAPLLGLLTLCTAAADTGEVAQQAGIDIIEVIFDETPIENGLSFDRTKVSPEAVSLGGKPPVQSWVSRSSIEPQRGWTRSFRFNVTDPRFQKGGRPAIDMEVQFHNPGLGSVRVKADTAEGAEQVGALWGNSKDWKTLRLSLDDAYFGARTDPGDTVPKLDNFDLRIDGLNGPFHLRSVRLIGYDPDQNIHWPRMLKFPEIKANGEGGLFAFTQSPGAEITATLQNIARVERPVRWRAQITDYSDTVRFQESADILLPPASSTGVTLAFDPSQWPLGPYDGVIEMLGTDGTVLAKRTFRLGLISSAELPKARQDEFLYGLDAANNTIFPILTPTAYSWYRLMGVDILRNPYNVGMKETVEDLQRAVQSLAEQGIQTAVMVDAPKELEADKRKAHLTRKVAFLEQAARSLSGAADAPHAGKIRYYEMGNEPDLPHFYPGNVADYAEDYHAMYDAVKRGARAAGLSDADTVVMNGGLAFAGHIGIERAVQLVELLDPQRLDAIAYHGHGPGIEAERTAWERLHAVASRHGKDKIPFIQTESGFSGVDRIGLEEQARTVVEKMTYAQSKEMPLFIFFRLFMEGAGVEGGYTMAENFDQPRPSVLSYRNMVERLRHHRFSRELDILEQTGTPGVTAYLFSGQDAQGGADGSKALVVFSEDMQRHELRLSLADSGQVENVRLYDMYGNQLPMQAADQGVITFTSASDPVFISWHSSAEDAQVRAMPSLLAAEGTGHVLAGATTPLSLSVRNPYSDQNLKAELGVQLNSRLGGTVTPQRVAIDLKPGSSETIRLDVTIPAATHPLRLPRWWTVFTNVDAAALSAADYARIPASLPRQGGGSVSPQSVHAPDERLNFGLLAGGFGEGRNALAYAVIDAPAAMELECGASGDWWMAWYLNGEPVLDTLENGNGQHGPISLHPFTLRLKEGRNVLVARVISGRGGWALQYGGPRELYIARHAGESPDSLTMTLKSTDGNTLATQSAPLLLQGALPVLPAGSAAGSTALEQMQWLLLSEPLAVLGSDSLDNLWMKEPDSSRWYTGQSDLSALLWLYGEEDSDTVNLVLAVTDDQLVQTARAEDLPQGDSVQLSLLNEAGESIVEVCGGLVGDQPQLLPPAQAGIRLEAVREQTPAFNNPPRTWYRFTLDKEMLGNAPLRLRLTVNDNDKGYLKQTLRFGEQPAQAATGRFLTP